MKVVNLSEFVSENSCRYDSEMNPKLSKKFFRKEDLIDEVVNDTELFDLYGLLYIYRSYFLILNGSIVQKILERCLDFMATNPHAVPEYMFKSLMRPLNNDKVLTNNYRNDNVRSVNINTILSFVNDLVQSKIVEKHYSEYEVLLKKIDEVTQQYFPGYNLQMVLLDDVIAGSELHTRILSGESVKNPNSRHLEHVSNNYYLEKSINRTIGKELLIYNMIVTQYTRDCVESLSSNMMIIFNTDEVENFREKITKNIVFFNGVKRYTCFCSWNDMRQWVANNSERIEDVISMIKSVRQGDAVIPKDNIVLYDYFTVLKAPLFNHVDSLKVGCTREDIERNKNKQKLFAGMETILERQLGNK